MGFFLPHRSRRVFSIFKFSKLFPFSDFLEASSRKKHSLINIDNISTISPTFTNFPSHLINLHTFWSTFWRTYCQHSAARKVCRDHVGSALKDHVMPFFSRPLCWGSRDPTLAPHRHTRIADPRIPSFLASVKKRPLHEPRTALKQADVGGGSHGANCGTGSRLLHTPFGM